VANAASHLLSGTPLLCTVDNAIDVHETLDAVHQVNQATEQEKRRRGILH